MQHSSSSEWSTLSHPVGLKTENCFVHTYRSRNGWKALKGRVQVNSFSLLPLFEDRFEKIYLLVG